MIDDPNTLPNEGGTEIDTSSENDTSNDPYDYFDPDEDTEEVAEVAETEDEDAGEDEYPDDDPDSDDEPAEPAPAFTDETLVALSDGTEVPVSDLKKGFMRQSDYTRKTQEAAEQRSALDAKLSQLDGMMQSFADGIAELIPPEPDVNLAFTDAAKYTQQKAQYDATVARLNKALEGHSAVKDMRSGLSDEDQAKHRAKENAALVEAFPEIREPEARQQFFGDVAQAATQVGFTVQELQGAKDHRLFSLAHWAQKGMAAEKAKASAEAKVNKAPAKAAPAKPAKGAQRPNSNKKAMARLRQSGSIKDALAVDFD